MPDQSALKVRVYFEDTDFSGRVYHGAYVRFLERARTEWLRGLGLDHSAFAAMDPPLYFTLRKLSLSFQGAAVIDDLLTVTATPEVITGATITVTQSVLRDDTVLVRASAELCVIDGAGRPRRLPPALVDALAA